MNNSQDILFEIFQGQWQWNNSQTPDSNIELVSYDDEVSIIIQTDYQLRKINSPAKYSGFYKEDVFIGDGFVADLREYYQVVISDRNRQRAIRQINGGNIRSNFSERFSSKISFRLFNEDQQLQDEDRIMWIAHQWWLRNNVDVLQKIPSFQMIKDGLVQQSLKQKKYVNPRNSMHQDDRQRTVEALMNTWDYIFDQLKIANKNSEIQWNQLEQKQSFIIRFILQLYSKELFIYQQIDEANLYKKEDYIDNLGPYSALLQYVLEFGQSNRNENKEKNFKAYRGAYLNKQQILILQQAYKDQKKSIFLEGIIRTSLNMKFAQKQLFKKQFGNQEQAVIFEIIIPNETQKNYFLLDQIDYSFYYKQEQEMLIQQGFLFQVLNIKTIDEDSQLSIQGEKFWLVTIQRLENIN